MRLADVEPSLKPRILSGVLCPRPGPAVLTGTAGVTFGSAARLRPIAAQAGERVAGVIPENPRNIFCVTRLFRSVRLKQIRRRGAQNRHYGESCCGRERPLILLMCSREIGRV